MSIKTIAQYSLVASVVTVTCIAFADGVESEYGSNRLDVRPVNLPLYQEECGSCHFAYQPGLLPMASWMNIMTNLDQHYGENAELDTDTQTKLLKYIQQHAADRANFGRFSRAYRYETIAPDAITSSRYFKRKHNEIPQYMVKGNEEVGSFSQCQACHSDAEKGSFDEHQVKIPRFGRWDD